ncbi:CehA/McbA family metallohydrolase [Acidobacteria bacterium AH-259-G07]|nr:CehA/McbA family metallohydrolase [Acidobacteria bacterium AH-259-G07]
MSVVFEIISLLSLILWPVQVSPAAELVVLSPQTWDEYAPLGKEVDAIYGDFVLRNDQIVAVVANPIEGRKANMKILDVGGCMIDLTSRQQQSDQLGAYYPVSRQFPLRFAGVETEASTVYEVSDMRHLFVRAHEVSLRLSAEPVAGNPDATVQYTLREGWPYVLVKTVYFNPTDRPTDFELMDTVRADRSRDLLAPELAPDGREPLFWLYDKWFGQAYGWVCEGRDIHCKTEEGASSPSNLSYLAGGETHLELGPGESFELTRRIFPGSNMLDVKAIAKDLAGVAQKRITLQVKDKAGKAVAGADVVLSVGEGSYAWGRTGSDGALGFDLPGGEYEVTVSALGQGSKSFSLDPSTATTSTTVLEEPGYVLAHIKDESGGPIPAKVQFRGKDGTEDPFFGPDSGEHAVHNLYYTHNGRFRQVLPPGRYDVIVSHGPEYDAVFTQMEITRGTETSLEATLVRSVQTPGWISSDFHSHSSPSGDNTSSQLGRVLNLLCEHIEFAPCTEHNRISTYVPHLKRLAVEDLMATCSGIELTSSPGSINHQNAFPLVLRPHIQDGGAPQISPDPEIQIQRLALWDNAREKVVQQNHPDMGQLFFDRNGDSQADEGYSRMFGFIDVIEVHPPIMIFVPATVTDPQGRVVNNRMFNWIQLLNGGMLIPGVVNTDAHANFHGSGWLRNYLKSPTDDPAQIRTIDMVRSAERGNLIMTNGPYLEVNLRVDQPGTKIQGTAGDKVSAVAGKVLLQVRVQCPNWFDIDRVHVFLNGRPVEQLSFTRETTPDLFARGTVKFNHEMSLQLQEDTHVIVAAVGEKSKLGPVMGPEHEEDVPVAVSNPIFVDVDGDGFKPNEDALGAPLPVKAGGR